MATNPYRERPPFGKQQIILICGLIGLIWLTFLIDRLAPLEQLGLRPRSLGGMPGIAVMPFLHFDYRHLMSNTVPLIVLLGLLAFDRHNSLGTVVLIILLSGVLLWCFGRSANHIGASGLVFGLAGYTVARGYKAQSFASFAAAAVTLFLYGGSLLTGILPTTAAVSWDGHLSGLVAGVAIARLR